MRNGGSILNLRNRYFLAIDALALSLTPLAAIILRLDTVDIPQQYVTSLIVYTAAALLLRLAVFYWFSLYRRFWRYASVEELIQIVFAVFAATAVIVLVFMGVRAVYLFPFPRSVLLIDGLLTLVIVGGSRFSVRVLAKNRRGGRIKASNRVLIMGAGDAGAMVVRELQKNPQRGLIPIGFLDDDSYKHHMQIHGVPVLGGQSDIPRLIREHGVDRVIIAMPTAPGIVIREIVTVCERAGVKTKIIPEIYDLLDGSIHVNQIRDVDIEDLLRREPVQTDTAAVRELIVGQRVLVTGGGGSIGGELCRQVLRSEPAELVLLGHGENSIFEIYHELQRLNSGRTKITPLIADTRFPERVQLIVKQVKPTIIFHAAAHKHVPMMEMNPAEAITNNVLGTQNLLEAALVNNVAHFVMISTDKAVNPSSVMGASKRVAELLVHRAARESGRPYVAVRFGNVLGSRGSVILTFKKQIAAGGPITITHPDIKRYFMTIPEAVQLVLQAAVLGQGGEVYVLDMGEPVKIMDLAHDLIELSGLEVGRDIAIEVVGLRPGEKLFEELFVPGENYERTRHEKIFIAGNASIFVPDGLDGGINALTAAAERNDRQAILRCLKNLVPEFDHDSGQNGQNDLAAAKRQAVPEGNGSARAVQAGRA